jgi:alkanesulfonate monooxygenase SsuD/methylene tetrahydromethanopterin reductase-like flavin-dependent oxidoreductase (luciferase family)
VKVGVILPIGDTDGPNGAPAFADIAAFARAAEDLGLDSGWVADHFFYRASDGQEYGLHEAWTVLSGVAAITTRIELGTLVLCTSFRNAVLTAKMAAAFDVVSNGRLILGLGSGWHEPEYDAMGLPFRDRVSRFEESLDVIRRLLDGERVTLDGRYDTVRDAVLLPPPARRIPILVAARKPRMLALAAARADQWNAAWYALPNERLLGELAAFDAAVAAAGRPRDAVARTVGIEIRDPDQPAVPEPSERTIDGDISQIAEALDAYEALGIAHVIAVLEPMTVRSVERLAEAVRLRSR